MNETMIKKDFHTHTVFCDGSATVEQMIQSAQEQGVIALGFSAHAPTFIEGADNYAMTTENEQKYIKSVKNAQKIAPINIYLGIEADYFSTFEKSNYDYVIGSVHHVKIGDRYFSIDDTDQILRDGVSTFYNGDYMAMVKDYYSLVAQLPQKTGCKIVGHFDIVNKFNKDNAYFDENSNEYFALIKNAVDLLLKQDVLFEINTSALYRKRSQNPNPSYKIIEYIANNGGKFVLSSDAHAPSSICGYFSQTIDKLKELGIKAQIIDFESVLK